jgi:3-phosphoshikimate 1-carboxyvinyltransferase
MVLKKFNLTLDHKISEYQKTINVDSDKSITIRSFLIGAISQNISSVNNVLESHDVLSAIDCLRKLGVKIKKLKSKNYKIYGKGIGSLIAKKNLSLNFGNSGTLARLLIGILSTTPNLELNMSGDKSLSKRNMQKLISLMSEFGAVFFPKNKSNFPLKLISSNMPIGIKYNAGVSAQLKSAVILAGLNSNGNTIIEEKEKSRDHTEKMLLQNKHVIKIKNERKKKIIVKGKKYLNPIHINVPSDPSSAAFFTALTLMKKKSTIRIKNVGLNQTRIGFYHLLKKHGANIKFKNLKNENNEIRGDIIVKSSKLKPIKASKKYYVSATDEYPILFIIASLTKGVSTFSGIGDLANKESNRIIEMQKVLRQVGIKSISSKNKLKIYGSNEISFFKKKIFVPGLGDHRICMSSFILAILIGAKAKIVNFETVFTSSPSFLKIMKNLGVKFETKKIS